MHESTQGGTVPGGVAAPVVDDDGLLRYAGRWIDVPDTQLPVVRLLVDRFGQLVRADEVAAAYTSAGGSGHDSTYRSAIARIRRRVAELGLELHAVRRRGVVLDAGPRRRRRT